MGKHFELNIWTVTSSGAVLPSYRPFRKSQYQVKKIMNNPSFAFKYLATIYGEIKMCVCSKLGAAMHSLAQSEALCTCRALKYRQGSFYIAPKCHRRIRQILILTLFWKRGPWFILQFFRVLQLTARSIPVYCIIQAATVCAMYNEYGRSYLSQLLNRSA